MPSTRSKDDPFKGEEELHSQELAIISMRKFGMLEKAIPDYLEGTLWAIPIMFLSENNKKVSTASCAVLGPIPLSEKRKLIKDLTGEKSTFSIRFPDLEGAAFSFRDSLTSDYLCAESLQIQILDENGALVNSEARKDVVIPPLSLRMFILPQEGGISCKISVLVYPLSTEDMAENHPYHSEAAFPGSSLWSAVTPLGIPTKKITRKRCGMPMLPVFRSTESLREEGFEYVPKTDEIKFKLSALMNSKTVPITLTGKTLLDRFASIKEHGESKVRKTLAAWSWPDVRDPSDKKGNKPSIIH